MAPALEIGMLSEFHLRYAGVPVPGVTTPRLQALLAYLLLHRGAPQPRSHLAALLWPDVVETQARNNLRQLLHQLRHALPHADHFVSSDGSTLSWREDAPYRCDVADFEHALAQAHAAARQGDRAVQRAALTAAVDLYRGELLPSCYDDWLVPERERLRQGVLDALAEVVQLLEAQRDYGAALHYAQTWVRQDPLAEDAYRALMQLYALSGDRARALRAYHTCVTVLRRELGVEPSAATRAVHERLLHLDAPPAPAPEDVPPVAALPAFVGRHREWARLRDVWQQVGTGRPQVVLLSGEPGIGKTRLAEEFLSWAHQQGALVARARSYAAEGQLSLAPVTDWLRSEGLRPHLERLDAVWVTELARVMPELSSARPALPRPAPITEFGQRQRFFEALARALLAAPGPLVLLLDDVQWCDQETLEWLHFLLRFAPAERLLVIGTVRAEELPAHHPLPAFQLHVGRLADLIELALQPLDAAEVAHLAAQVAGHALADAAVLRLFRETEGVPLFVVETLRARDHPLDHRGDAVGADSPGGHPALPPQVQAVLAGRLTQLSPSARELAGLAAAVGRAFTLDILLRAAGDEDTTVRALDELWTRRIVREHGLNSYDFSHDKLREVAYAALGPPQRRLYHRRIAQAFEVAHADDLDAVSGQIASHYERAGLAEQAIPHYQRAALVAQQIYANDEAISLLQATLALLERLPANLARDRQELELLLALAPTLRVARGWAAPELEQVLGRAQALCDKVGDEAQYTQVLYGLQSLSVVQGRLERVQYTSDELETLYRRAHGTAPPHFAGVMLGGARFHLGHLRDADARFATITTIHDPDQVQRLEEAQGANYRVLALAWQAHALWCLGYPESALTRGHAAVQLARDLVQPFNHALAAAYLALLLQFGADDATAATHADNALALAEECKALYYRAWAAILVAYTRAWAQPDEEHIARLRDAIAALTATGARLRLPYYLGLLARTYQKAGRTGEGLAALEEALEASRAQNERWWDAELHRLRGDLLHADGADEGDVEAAFVRALQIARSQEARTLELRAALSLARLWQRQGRAAEGRRLLEDLCAWFTEGQELPDLQAARALLTQRR